MDAPPIENGAVAVSGNRIIGVGKFDEIKARNSGEVIDLGKRALLPGLINAHCHLDYTSLRGKIPPQKSFADWIRAVNAEKVKLASADYLASIEEGFAEAKRFGTTTIANLTAFPDLIAQIHSPIRTWWFAELIDVRSPEHANELVDRAIQSLNSSQNWGLAPHALFTASATLYRRCQEFARSEHVLLTTHLAESREEMSMFREGSGRLCEFMKSIGRDMSDCGRETPLARFLGLIGRSGSPNRPQTPIRLGSIEVNRPYLYWIIAHLNELTESDFELLEGVTEKFHVAHCPRSHGYFGHSRFPYEKLRAIGFNICLGTDSLASNENLSLLAEMRAFQDAEPGISPDQILQMVTVNPATALRQENALGRIRPGLQADFISLPYGGPANLLEEIVAFDAPVDWMMINGKMRDLSAAANLPR